VLADVLLPLLPLLPLLVLLPPAATVKATPSYFDLKNSLG